MERYNCQFCGAPVRIVSCEDAYVADAGINDNGLEPHLCPMKRQCIVFVDWFRTLTHDLLWQAIHDKADHRLHDGLTAACNELFTDHERVDKWMRAEISTKDIITSFSQHFNQEIDLDYLFEAVGEGLRASTLCTVTCDALKRARKHAHIWIATDNIECFNDHWPHIPGLNDVVEGVVNSADLGLLKSDTRGFFEKSLRTLGLDFEDAILIDDREDNCKAFCQAGGHAIHHTDPKSTADQLDEWIKKMRMRPASKIRVVVNDPEEQKIITDFIGPNRERKLGLRDLTELADLIVDHRKKSRGEVACAPTN